MKKICMSIISIMIFLTITGCTNNQTENNSNISSTSSQDSSSDETSSEVDINDYFTVDTEDKSLSKFMTISDSYGFEQYVKDNITSITIDDCVYNIRKTKFSDVIENLKKYVTDENSLKYLNNPGLVDSSDEKQKFNIKANISNAVSVILRFTNSGKAQNINDYELYSFTISYNVHSAEAGDKVISNFECVVPLILKEDIWKSKISENVKVSDININMYYLYHNSEGFAIDENTAISGYSIQTAFDRETGYLVYFSYEVNS